MGAHTLAGLEHLARLALSVTHDVEESLDQYGGLFLRGRLQEGEAADHLLGFGERPIAYSQFAVGEANARAGRARPSRSAFCSV